VKLNPEQIRLDGGTQPRAVLNKEQMEGYADLMRDGVEFPPVTVFYDGENYWLADGFHRVGAAAKAFPTRQIEAEVHQGTLQDAQWFSYGVNKGHGLNRTNQDKERAAKAALAARPDLSDPLIAKHVGVHPDTVTKYRAQMKAEPTYRNSVSRTGRDGRTINTARIGRHARLPSRRGKGKAGAAPSMSPEEYDTRRSAQAAEAAQPGRPVTVLGRQLPQTALSLPHDPKAAARTLISVFDRAYLKALVTELTNHLKGTQS
jgi:hypothetical protein